MKNRCGKELYTYKFYKRNKLIFESNDIGEFFAKRNYEENIGVHNVLWTRIEVWSTDETPRLITVLY